jgi:ribosome-associated protein
MIEWLQVDDQCAIDLDEVEVKFSRSSGPGGQHANKTSTRVELRFDIAGSPSLDEAQRRRLLDRVGPEVRVVADDERSQVRNRAIAIERLRSRLAAGLRVERRRRATRPTRGSQLRRLEGKRRTGDTKRQRRKPDVSD